VGPPENADEGEWGLWWEKFTSDLLYYSESRSVAVCKDMAERLSLIKHRLFPISFALAYSSGLQLEALTRITQRVFESRQCPPYVVRGFLGALEIFEVLPREKGDAHDGIQIDTRTLAQRAVDAELFAQGLRLFETVLEKQTNAEAVEALVSLNQQLGLPLAARGLLQFCEASTSQARLFERLGLWEEALKAYQSEPQPNVEGVLSCLRALSRFSELKQAAASSAHFLACAHWHLFEHAKFGQVAARLPAAPQNSYFILLSAVMNRRFDQAELLLREMNSAGASALFPSLGEDYERVYADFAESSFLAEVSEVIEYHRSEKARMRILHTWQRRFVTLLPIPSVLHGHLCLRSLVLSVGQQRESFLLFLAAALEHGRLEAAESVLAYCLAKDPCDAYDVARSRLLWARGDRDGALTALFSLRRTRETVVLLSKWLLAVGRTSEARAQLQPATADAAADVELWELWSTANLQATPCFADALAGTINALVLAPKNALTFTLTILGILFDHEDAAALALFEQRVSELPVSVWIPVLPQILSRLASPSPVVRAVAERLVISVGFAQPHAVLFPLHVPLSLAQPDRCRSATDIIARLRAVHPRVVIAVLALAAELERVSVTWWESAVAIIDEASRAFVNRSDRDEMLTILDDLESIRDRTPTTLYETSFTRDHGENLRLAAQYADAFRVHRDEISLENLWHFLTNAFYAMKPVTKDLTVIHLADASPALAALRDSEVPVPGTFDAERPIVRIASVQPQLTVIESKQRPRRMALMGSDGLKYTFLLKAHEDTRLDERVMQLFSFINQFIETSTLPLRSRLCITTYKVIPITAEVGLIGWVQDCTILFDILTKYRERKRIPTEIELQYVTGIAPNYDQLPVSDQKRLFMQASAKSDGKDLKVMLFDNSADSADWLDRRTNFTASLATTSMAGYILGLGDRHMCNIMMKNRSAKLVHIDFGDCFEVAMHRERFPEKVPFRLTRLLVNALESGGIKGTFRASSANLMRLLRRNASQIVGLLSVFVCDPLRQWSVGEANEGGEATAILGRIADKLDGNDFPGVRELGVEDQVDRLISQATAPENLCGMFKGWYPWW
jgi:FKBP12-rapamycin complex-associated protein